MILDIAYMYQEIQKKIYSNNRRRVTEAESLLLYLKVVVYLSPLNRNISVVKTPL